MDKFDQLKDLMEAKFNEINNKLLEMQNKINLLEIKFQIMFGKDESKNNEFDQKRIDNLHNEINYII